MSWQAILGRLSENQVIRMKKDYSSSSFEKKHSDINVLYFQRFGSLNDFSRKNQSLNANTIGIVKSSYNIKDGTYLVQFDTMVNSGYLSDCLSKVISKLKYSHGPVVKLNGNDLFDIAEVWVEQNDSKNISL